jgi:peptidoglycan/LPS O-acetylase OafA/YrhL
VTQVGPRHARRRVPPVPQQGSGGFRPDIEGLRAVAVGLVVLFHAGVAFVPGGYVGVDVFFVLSGFLITGLLLAEVRKTGTVSLRSFWARRARRLLPMSALVLVVTAVAAYRILPPLDAGGISADVRAAALYFANWHFGIESTDYLAEGSSSPVLHYWSLAVEEQFYLVWPLLMLLVLRGIRNARDPMRLVTRRLAVALALVGGVSLFLSATTSATSAYAYYGLHTRAWELAAGAALALAGAWLAATPRLLAVAAGWTGLAMVVVSALVLDETTAFPGTAALLPVVGTMLLVVAGARAGTVGASRLLVNPVMRYVGRISYAWYLWHWPCLILGAALAQPVAAAGEDGAAPAGVRVVLLAVLVSFLLAVVSHHVVEQPMRKAGWLAAARGRSLALGAALTAASVVAASGMVVSLVTVQPERTTAGDSLAAAEIEPIEPGPEVGTGDGSARRGAVRAARASNVVLAAPDADRTTLTPEEARKDVPSGGSGCYVLYDSETVGEDCLFGDPDGDRTIVLIGDSHAQQWFPALERLARERGWQLRVWAKSACPPQFVRVVKANGSDYPGCSSWRDAMIERLTALPRVDAVVVGRVWLYEQRVVAEDGSDLDGDEVLDAWEEGSRQLYEALGEVAKDVVMLRDVPFPRHDVPACLSEAPDDLRRCDFPREGHIGLDERLVAAEERAAEGRSDVHVMDLTEELCPVDPCPAVTRDGTVMYRDDDHLAASFAARLWSVLGRELDAIMDAG